MRTKLIVGTLVLAATGASLFGWRTAPRAIADDACAGAGSTSLVTIADGHLTDGHGGLSALDDAGGAYVIRYVATNGDRSAYVRDLPGDDAVVIASPNGVPSVVPQHGEVAHPAWGRHGELAWGLDDDLVVRTADGALQRIAGPRTGGIVTAPVFDGAGVVAAVAAGPTQSVPEGGWSDDLWRLADGRWRRLTTFPADDDRWSAIPTVMTAPDGAVEFVVVTGRASATQPPRFALYRLVGDGPELVEQLPGEAYLAGYTPEGGRLWNVPDRANERWLLRTEFGEPAGCGAVAVDPMDRVDPDRTGHAAPASVARSGHVELGDPAEVALLVGDFASRDAAAIVAARLTTAYAGALPVDLIHGGARSSVVRPGAWVVVVRLGADTDGVAELARLRANEPDLARHTWIVVP